LTSPRNKPPTGLRTQKFHNISPPKLAEVSKQEVSIYEMSAVKELVEKKFEECVKMIETKLSIRKDTEENLQVALQEHLNCDQQEFSILCTVELLLSEGKIEEALRLIRWRKKLLKVAQMNGWDVATELARKTLFKLDVSTNDLIEVNLRLSLTEQEEDY